MPIWKKIQRKKTFLSLKFSNFQQMSSKTSDFNENKDFDDIFWKGCISKNMVWKKCEKHFEFFQIDRTSSETTDLESWARPLHLSTLFWARYRDERKTIRALKKLRARFSPRCLNRLLKNEIWKNKGREAEWIFEKKEAVGLKNKFTTAAKRRSWRKKPIGWKTSKKWKKN